MIAGVSAALEVAPLPATQSKERQTKVECRPSGVGVLMCNDVTVSGSHAEFRSATIENSSHCTERPHLNAVQCGVDRILIVDDQSTQRRKLSLALQALGYASTTAASGSRALDLMRDDEWDLVLLDILMPDLDGFEVLDAMNADERLRDVPVIVISALEGDMGSVVRAIESGAKDVLPKSFDPVLLRARIETSLIAKRARDRERGYLARVDELTEVAAVLERCHVDPATLGLVELGANADALGRLARVFGDMANQVYARERRLRHQIRTFRSSVLLVAVGLVFGLSVPAARMAALESPTPFGIALWVNAVCAIVCLSSAAWRRRLPSLTRATVSLFAAWGTFATLMGSVVLYAVARYLDASLIAVLLVTEGFLVFAMAAALRIEPARPRRLLGFMVGLIGLASVMVTVRAATTQIAPVAVLVVLLAPLGYALRTLLITLRMPDDMDTAAAAGGSALAGMVLVVPVVWWLDDWVPIVFDGSTNRVIAVIVLLGAVSAAGTTLRAVLIRKAGAVFASQSCLFVTLAGVGWSYLLLGERLPATGWLALALMLVGVVLVGPKEDADPYDRGARNRPIDDDVSG